MVKLSDELRRRVAIAIAQPFKEVNKNLIVSLHGEVFSSNLCHTCENEQILAYIELTRLIQKNKEMSLQEIVPPSEKYRFNPKHEDATISVPSKHWNIKADTLTDDQADWMNRRGTFTNPQIIVTIEEAEKIRKEMAKEAKAQLEEVAPKETKPVTKKRTSKKKA